MQQGERVAILMHRSIGDFDNIREYSERLVEELNQQPGTQAELHAMSAAGRWDFPSSGGLTANPNLYRAVVLQYNPFAYGRWGFSPGMLVEMWRQRRAKPAPTIALMAHEMYVPMGGVRMTVMGLWQRLQFFALASMADIVFVAIEPWLRRVRLVRRVAHLPVPSTLPDMRIHRDEARVRLGADANCVVLVGFWSSAHHHLSSYLARAANAVAATGKRSILVYLGPGASRPESLDSSTEFVMPGWSPAGEVSKYVAAGDILLAPIPDGVSTRRTSVMAGLQHGLAVVATDGPATDVMLRHAAALELVPVNQPDQFAAAARRLAENQPERLALGQRARSLYEQTFDWPHVAERLLRVLGLRA